MSARPIFSLVLATVGRTEEVRRFLHSLSQQEGGTIELIIVDQNEDDRLVSLLAEVRPPISCFHVRSPRGLSRARNRGLDAVRGELVAFPDDDCWYAPQLLREIQERFNRHPDIDGWMGMTRDASGVPSASRWSTQAGKVTKNSIWTRAMSPTIFIRRSAVEVIGRFDESLGVGAGTEWGSGEETDYLLRGLQAGLHFMYDPSIIVFHPQVASHLDTVAQTRARSYGMGFGWVLRTHRYPFSMVLYHWARSFVGAAAALARGDLAQARFSWRVLGGRIRGYCSALNGTSIGGRSI